MWKKVVLISTAIIVLACTGSLQAQSDPASSDDSRSRASTPYKPYRPSPSLSPRGTAKRLYMMPPYYQPTHKVERTKPSSSEDRNTSDLQTIERTKSAKEEFLRMRGYKSLPPGYEVDYIVPLSQGGRDYPGNMQLVPKKPEQQKAAGKGTK